MHHIMGGGECAIRALILVTQRPQQGGQLMNRISSHRSTFAFQFEPYVQKSFQRTLDIRRPCLQNIRRVWVCFLWSLLCHSLS